MLLSIFTIALLATSASSRPQGEHPKHRSHKNVTILQQSKHTPFTIAAVRTTGWSKHVDHDEIGANMLGENYLSFYIIIKERIAPKNVRLEFSLLHMEDNQIEVFTVRKYVLNFDQICPESFVEHELVFICEPSSSIHVLKNIRLPKALEFGDNELAGIIVPAHIDQLPFIIRAIPSWNGASYLGVTY